jgi:hypothetical protein
MMTDDELRDRAKQVIEAVIEDADKRTVWDAVRDGRVDPLTEDKDAHWVIDWVHRAHVTITFD